MAPVIMSKTFTLSSNKVPASDLEIGSSVFLNVDGSPKEFIVVHQGNPDSSLYDVSCDGTWLLMKDIYKKCAWHNTNNNSYKSSDAINSINWSDKNRFIDIFNYTKGLIAIRKNLPYFNIDNADIIKNKAKFIFANNNENSGVIINHIDLSEYDKGEVVVIYNATSIDNYDVNSYIPISKTGYWNIIANDKIAGLNILKKVNSNEIPKLKSFSIMILCNKINK